jgi:hypothetical protein
MAMQHHKPRYSVRDCSDIEVLATDSALCAAEARQRHWTIVDTVVMRIVMWDEWDQYGSRPLLVHETSDFADQCSAEAAPRDFLAPRDAIAVTGNRGEHVVLSDMQVSSVSARLRYGISRARITLLCGFAFLIVSIGLLHGVGEIPSAASRAAPTGLLEYWVLVVGMTGLIAILSGFAVNVGTSELRPLDARRLADLLDMSRRSPRIAAWIDPALMAGHTLRYRDYYAAETIKAAEIEQKFAASGRAATGEIIDVAHARQGELQ